MTTILRPLTASEITQATTGASYGPPAPAAFPDGPFTVNSGVGVPLSGGPAATSSTGVVLFISTNNAAALGTQYITISIDGIGTAKLGSADFMSTAAAGFPDSIPGIANGSVNGINFPSAQHAAVLLDFGEALAKNAVLGNVSI